MSFTSKGLPMVLIVVFVLLMASPFLMNLSSETVKKPVPEIAAKIKGKECVRSAVWMRANHMQLLDDWRNEVVRDSERDDVYKDKHTDKSLTRTCLKCHENKTNFCDRCHTYASVKPYCWTCHVAPKEKI